jgi:APA family basic amino acid/polyamine antiporter
MRRREPDTPRLYRAPAAWVVGPFAIAGCLYLFANLQLKTQLFFAAWNLVGLCCYFAWRQAQGLRERAGDG